MITMHQAFVLGVAEQTIPAVEAAPVRLLKLIPSTFRRQQALVSGVTYPLQKSQPSATSVRAEFPHAARLTGYIFSRIVLRFRSFGCFGSPKKSATRRPARSRRRAATSKKSVWAPIAHTNVRRATIVFTRQSAFPYFLINDERHKGNQQNYPAVARLGSASSMPQDGLPFSRPSDSPGAYDRFGGDRN